MSWQDRDYASQHTPVRPVGGGRSPFAVGSFGQRSVVSTLIIVNVAVFVLCNLTATRGQLLGSPFFQWGAMSGATVLHGQVWRLFTADYLHVNFGHILMNMIGLHFLGRQLERDWGSRTFFLVYTVAGLLGSVFYAALCFVGWLPMSVPAVGASGCVLGLLGAAAVKYPQAEVLVYFLFPIKIRTAALVFGGWYTLNLFTKGDNAGGDACHLAGMLFGAWWVVKGNTWESISAQFRRGRARGAKMRTRSKKPSAGGFRAKVAQRHSDEDTIDRILKKVYEGGIHSLTDREKRALQEATDRQRADEQEAGRMDRL